METSEDVKAREAAAAKAEAERQKADDKKAKAADDAGLISTHEDALEAGYYGITQSRVPTEVHEAGNEELRAELYGSAPNPESTRAIDPPHATMENAKAALVRSTELVSDDVVNKGKKADDKK